MKTTELFAELLVIGIGGCALVMTLALIAAPELATWSFDPVRLFLPTLVAAYVLGIVIDRLADGLFTFAFGSRSPLAITSEQMPEYREATDRALEPNPRAAQLHAYNRTRQRICRSWTLLGIGLGATIPFAVVSLGMTARVGRVASVAFVFLAVGCFLAWYALKQAEEREILRLANSRNGSGTGD